MTSAVEVGVGATGGGPSPGLGVDAPAVGSLLTLWRTGSVAWSHHHLCRNKIDLWR